MTRDVFPRNRAGLEIGTRGVWSRGVSRGPPSVKKVEQIVDPDLLVSWLHCN